MTASDRADLLASLTLEEKASLCSGSGFWLTQAIPRVGIKSIMLTDGPHGLRKQTEDGDHLGLGASVPATCFPTAAALGSSWDPDLVQRVGEALGAEARAEHVAVLLGPGINIKRTPLCGRNFEYLSEDPVLTAELAAGYVNGVQSQGVGTSVKHFAANNQETDRMRISAEVDERTLREIYLAAFEHVVTQARPWTVMCSYNKLNGIYTSQHPWLLTEVLREEWGFDGLVVSDWGAVEDRVAGLKAGLDLEMPSSGGLTDAQLVAAVRAGHLDEAVLDLAVSRLLRLLDRTGPAVELGGSYDRRAHHALAREVARDCAVLLKNDGGLLPLDPSAPGSIAVIGEFARTPRYQGAGSSQVNPTLLDIALDQVRAACSREITFAPGYGVDERNDSLIVEAAENAAAAETVVLFLGLPPSYESEGWDRSDMNLPDDQIEVLRAVADANPRVVVVLANGGVVAVDSWQQQVPAILEGWLLGQAGGGAIADLLFGSTSPSGRLAETIPQRLQDNPSFGNFPGENGVVRYGEGLLVGYRYYDAKQLPVSFPFGHGLSYTTFGYTNLSATVRGEGAQVSVDVAVTVTNTGSVAGKEVVQVYVRDPEASVFRPERELKAFAKVALAPGESRQVRFTLAGRDFAYFHSTHPRWVVEGGAFEIEVGASSRDIRCRISVQVEGEPVAVPLTADSTLAEWMADPASAAILRHAYARAGMDPDGVKMLGSIPLSRLARFPGSPIRPDDLEAMIAEADRG